MSPTLVASHSFHLTPIICLNEAVCFVSEGKRLMLSAYERDALAQIEAWKEPEEKGWLGRVGQAITYPVEVAGKAVRAIPGADLAVEKSVGGLVSLLNDAAQWSVSPPRIFTTYQDAGHKVQTHQDIFSLDLQEVDRVMGALSVKYRALAAVEGAGTGAAGALGIPVDVVALVTLNLRAIGEFGTYCGFDMSTEQERLYAMQILSLSASPSDATKQVAITQLVKISKDVASKQTMKQLERHTFVKVIQELAKALGIRLTRAKLAQLLPLAGAVVGGGFNAYYTNKTCETAFYMYRERFLLRKQLGDL